MIIDNSLLIFTPNIHCLCSLESPRRDGFKVYPESMIFSLNEKKKIPLLTPIFNIKMGFPGCSYTTCLVRDSFTVFSRRTQESRLLNRVFAGTCTFLMRYLILSYSDNKMAHRWLVLLAAVFVSTFEFGLLFSLSALYLPILETFHTDRATAALVQSVSLGVTMSTGE